MDANMMDDMATDYLNGMYESQYDDDEVCQKKEVSSVSPNEAIFNDEEIPF